MGETNSQPLYSIKQTCNVLWFNTILNIYIQFSAIIKVLIAMKEGYYYNVFSDNGCDIVIQFYLLLAKYPRRCPRIFKRFVK